MKSLVVTVISGHLKVQMRGPRILVGYAQGAAGLDRSRVF